MTFNDIAYWYYVGLAVQIIYVIIQLLRRKTGDDAIRLQKMQGFADEHNVPISVLYVILAIYCLFWPFFFVRKILTLCGVIKQAK